jgi:probable phosphoglycerate mutase
LLVRHAEAEGNIKRLFHGWTDGHITDVGHKQAELLAKNIADYKIDVLYSSTLTRAIQTAEYISKTTDLPIIKKENLKEINGGDWEGVPWEDLPKFWPEDYRNWEDKPFLHKMPNGESMQEFLKRLVTELMKIISENQGANICVVTHGTAIRVLMSYFYFKNLSRSDEIPWYDNTSITIVEYKDNDFEIILEGDTKHLTDNLKTIESQEWWQNKQERILESKNLKENE